jgi:hypothetical protein
MTCPQCGYVLSPFDEKCPRCDIQRTKPVQSMTPRNGQTKWLMLGTAAVGLLFCAVIWMLGTLNAKRPKPVSAPQSFGLSAPIPSQYSQTPTNGQIQTQPRSRQQTQTPVSSNRWAQAPLNSNQQTPTSTNSNQWARVPFNLGTQAQTPISPNQQIQAPLNSSGQSQTTRVPDRLPSEPAPRPAPRLQGSAHIGDARLNFVNDGHGNEHCVGRVLVVNDGPYDLVDFRLGLRVSGLTYALVPFEGSIDFPMSLPSYRRRIRPGGSLDVPVMTTGVYTSFSVYGLKTVTLDASLDGPPYRVSDERTLW